MCLLGQEVLEQKVSPYQACFVHMEMKNHIPKKDSVQDNEQEDHESAEGPQSS